MTMARATNSAGKPNRAELTWCLVGNCAWDAVADVSGCALPELRLTVDKGVFSRAIPCWLLSNADAVPGCTLPDLAPGDAGWPTVCGFWVVVCVPPPVVAVNWLSIRTIVALA